MDLVLEGINRYSGHAKIQRLLHFLDDLKESHSVADADTTNGSISTHAAEARNALETTLRANSHPLATGHGLDESWHAAATARNQEARQEFQGRVHQASAQLHKDAIRNAHLQWAEHETVAAGNLSQAWSILLRAKDYCTSRVQTTQILVLLLETAVALGDWSSVADFAGKLGILEQRSNSSSSPGSNSSNNAQYSQATVQRYAAICQGLCALQRRDYERAAACFAQLVQGGSGNNEDDETSDWTTVLTNADVHWFAGLLAICTPRPMVDYEELGKTLEAAPPLQQACMAMAQADYRACWTLLEEQVFPVLRMDMYMAKHLEPLKAGLREKCCLLYWKVYRRVELSSMAEVLGPGIVPSPADFPNAIVGLLEAGKLPNSRLDMERNILIKNVAEMSEDHRIAASAHHVARTSQQILDDTYMNLVRVACHDHGLEATSAAAYGGGRRRRKTRKGMGVHSMSDDDDDDDDDGNMDHDMPDANVMDLVNAMMANPEEGMA